MLQLQRWHLSPLREETEQSNAIVHRAIFRILILQPIFLSHTGQQQMSQLRRSTKRQLQVLAFVACTIGAVYYLSTRDTEAQHEEAKPWDEPPVRVESRRIGNA